MANAWRREKQPQFLSSRFFLLLFSSSLLLLIFYFLSLRPSSTDSPVPTALATKSRFSSPTISPFNRFASPQAHPVIANVVEGIKHPFLYSLSDFRSLPDKPHKNIVRTLKGKAFRRPDISVTVQELLERFRSEGRDGIFVDVGANVGMASFAAATMGFRVLAFEPVFENLQRICDGIWMNRVGKLMDLFAAAASDRVGNITFHKLDNSAVSADGAKLAFKSNEEIELQVRSIPLDEVIPESELVLLIQIDVQGWERHVLKGAVKLLSRKAGKAPYLIYEEDEQLLQASNSSSKEIREFLHSVGYHHCTQHGTDAHCTKNG